MLADRRRCPYLDDHHRIRPPAHMKMLAAGAGVSCEEACKHAGGVCDVPTLEWGNTCEALAQHFECEAGCGHQVSQDST